MAACAEHSRRWPLCKLKGWPACSPEAQARSLLLPMDQHRGGLGFGKSCRNQLKTPSNTSKELYRLVVVEAMDIKFYGPKPEQLTSTITDPAQDGKAGVV